MSAFLQLLASLITGKLYQAKSDFERIKMRIASLMMVPTAFSILVESFWGILNALGGISLTFGKFSLVVNATAATNIGWILGFVLVGMAMLMGGNLFYSKFIQTAEREAEAAGLHSSRYLLMRCEILLAKASRKDAEAARLLEVATRLFPTDVLRDADLIRIMQQPRLRSSRKSGAK